MAADTFPYVPPQMTVEGEDAAMKHARSNPLTAGQWVLSIVAGILMLALAALAFRGMFSSVRAEMVPFFGSIAWIVPIGVDLGIVIMILIGVLLEWLAMPMPQLRWVAAFFMACSVWLNVLTAHGQPAGVVGHVSLPALFIASVEAVRHAVRRRSGLAAGTVREGIPATRWLLAPVATFALWRRMVLWQVTSYRKALDREQLRRRLMARLQAEHGAKWRTLADSGIVWQLTQGIDVEGAEAAMNAPSSPPAAKPRSTTRATSAPRQKNPAAHARARRIMATDPSLTLAQVAKRTGLSERTLSRIRNRPPELVASVS